MRTITLTILFLLLILVSFQASARNWHRPWGFAKRVAQLEAQVEALTTALEETQELLQFVSIVDDEMAGLSGPHIIIEGANVHVRSGSGSTGDGCHPRNPDHPNCESLTGLGNLIVGYNDQAPVRRGGLRETRTGSHNLIIGEFHSYSSFGGFVAGMINSVSGNNASVSGGSGNHASGSYSSISGGHLNVASGTAASVSGGQDRDANNDFNWAAGSLLEPN